MPIIHTAETINRGLYPHFTGVRNNNISGTADYGNTSSSWNTSGTDKLHHSSGEDPALGSVKWNSQSKYEGWMNTTIGTSSGRYLTGDHLKGCKFQWRTNPNEDGGITLRRWGVGICSVSGTHKRWSSSEVNRWSTSSSWFDISVNFSGELLNQLNRGWQLNALHFMVHTPYIKKTPGSNNVLEIRNFEYIYKCSYNAIIPAMRDYSNRDSWPIA
jgi:hypothetical protein